MQQHLSSAGPQEVLDMAPDSIEQRVRALADELALLRSQCSTLMIGQDAASGPWMHSTHVGAFPLHITVSARPTQYVATMPCAPEQELTEDAATDELVLKARSGSESAWRILHARFDEVVFAIVLRRVRNRERAQDVSQNVWIQAFRCLDQLKDPTAFPGWLKQIAARLAINESLRNAPMASINGDPDEPPYDVTDPTDHSPLHHLERQEAAAEVHSAVEALRASNPVIAHTLEAFYFERLSLVEIAEGEGGTPLGTIKRRLHTGRLRLRAIFGEMRVERLQEQD